MLWVKIIIKRLFLLFGVEITRLGSRHTFSSRLVKGLHSRNVDCVLDVGANSGQFARSLRASSYRGFIASFEPLSQAHALLTRVAETDANWFVYPRCAIGAIDGEVFINVSKNSVSSSIMPMLESHSLAAPDSLYVSKELTKLYSLDIIASDLIERFDNPFLKIDTQGFESEVLKGAISILPNIRGVLIELSLVKLYEGQELWDDLVNRLRLSGFQLWGLSEGFIDPRTGGTLQVDAVFFRN